MDETSILPVLLSIIAVFAGFLNLFIAFVLKSFQGEIKSLREVQDKTFQNIYDRIRENENETANDVQRIDEHLHKIKTEIVKMGVILNRDE